jgi:hypothetical protein
MSGLFMTGSETMAANELYAATTALKYAAADLRRAQERAEAALATALVAGISPLDLGSAADWDRLPDEPARWFADAARKAMTEHRA